MSESSKSRSGTIWALVVALVPIAYLISGACLAVVCRRYHLQPPWWLMKLYLPLDFLYAKWPAFREGWEQLMKLLGAAQP